MSDMDQYMPPVELNDPMRGVVCGTVVKSNHPDYAKGAIVGGLGVWADYQIGAPPNVNPMGDTGPLPVVNAFSTFAVVGPTAYFGLIDIGQPKEGETVVVSAAASSVGSIVGQIAKIKGCRVVGLAGTNEKCAWIAETDSPRPVPFPPPPPQTAAHCGPCSEVSPVLWDCLTSHLHSSLSCSLGIHSADLVMRPNVGPPGSRAKSLCTCPGSLTTQGPTASRSSDTAGVAFHLEDRVGTLKFTISFAAQ